MKIIGIIPARLAASRFPNKPLKKILGVPMIDYVYKRSKFSSYCSEIFLTSPDKQIEKHCFDNDIPFIKTHNRHIRALDRVAEAAEKINSKDGDIITCIQGDEPMQILK